MAFDRPGRAGRTADHAAEGDDSARRMDDAGHRRQSTARDEWMIRRHLHVIGIHDHPTMPAV